jgi:hypothetical protein
MWPKQTHTLTPLTPLTPLGLAHCPNGSPKSPRASPPHPFGFFVGGETSGLATFCRWDCGVARVATAGCR